MRRPGLILALWVILLGLCAWPFSVRAAGIVTQTAGSSTTSYCWGWPNNNVCNGTGNSFSTAEAARASFMAALAVSYPGCQQTLGVQWYPDANHFSSQITGNCAATYSYLRSSYTTTTPASCPANSSLVNGSCICAANYVPGGNPYASACEPVSAVCPSFAAGISGEYQFSGAAVQSSTFCDSTTSCELKGAFAACIGSDCSVVGPYTATGKDCTAGAPSVVEPQVCPAGQVSSVVGGNTVCVTPTSTSTSSSSTSTAPAGSASAPMSSVSGGGTTVGVPPGGSTESTTTCVGTQCVTSVTVKDASGATVGTVSSSAPKDAFCVENPDATICKASSFSGACSTAFACDGDAIQCAIASDQHVRNCQLFEGQHETRTVAENALNGVPDPEHPGADGNVSSIAIDSMIDTGSIIGAGSCPTDVSYAIPILGTMVVPWSHMCSWLQLMGTILVAAAGVTWLFIVFGSKGV